MRILLPIILSLVLTSQASVPRRWKVSYINDMGFVQWQYVPGSNIEDAIDYLYWIDPQASILSACNTDYAECEAKGEEGVPPMWARGHVPNK